MVQESSNDADFQGKARRAGQGATPKVELNKMVSEGVDQIGNKFSELPFDWKTILTAVGVIGGIGAFSAYALKKQGRKKGRSHTSTTSSSSGARRGRRSSSTSARAH